ncbi:MAG TPA: 50S ribosomal protein L10 [Candidatus Limnocylindria bacterium]|nr:50S ribosomal protein L10 [Candidatus Limnocylindria bacterium]HEV2063293.1 50S ribosomal protein L10 [Thermoanaerobaculia bacterium]
MAKVKTGPKTKRKGGGVPAKAKAVEGLQRELERSTAIIVTEYRGLTVAELQDLRRKLRPKGVEYHVVKNSLFTRAAEGSGRGALRSLLSGPTAVALGTSDEVDLAKGLIEETRTFKTLKIVGGFLGGRVMSAEDVQSLAKLPPKPQLQATLVASLLAPLSQMVAVLQAPLAQLIRVLNAKAQAE